MCQLASFIITRERVLFHPELDSHEKIIEHFKLDDKRTSDFVRVEMVPPEGNYLLPLKQWEYELDQRETPEWYNAKNAEESVRDVLPVWKMARPWFFDAMKLVRTIKKVKWYNPTRRPRKVWKVYKDRAAAGAAARAARAAGAAAGAAWDAAWDAARNAAGDAAGVAAWVAARDAAWVAAGVAARVAAGVAAWDAARVAAWVAARAAGAAGDAAWDAAWDAAGDAAGDAALLARCLVVSDKLDSKHMMHAKVRWDVWESGYGLFCDVDGVLYVYRKP
jgi:hypothetical protein